LTEKSLSKDVLYRDADNVWNKLTEMPAKSFNQCVAVLDGFLYVAGGEDQNDARNQAKHAVSNFCRYLLIHLNPASVIGARVGLENNQISFSCSAGMTPVSTLGFT